MIPSLVEILERLGVARELIAAVSAALLTAIVLLAPSVARWFDKRNP
jgi:hypothetical protein